MIKKRLLIFTEYFYPEEFVLNELVLSLKKKGFEITIFTQNPSYPSGKMFKGYRNKIFYKEFWNQIPVYRIFTITGYKRNLFLKLFHYLCFDIFGIFFSFFIGKSYDYVFIYHLGPLTTAVPGIIYSLINNKKTYIWTQDVWPDSLYAFGIKKARPLSTVLDMFGKWVYKHCEKIFVSSENFINFIKAYAPYKTIEFMPQWSNVPERPLDDNVINDLKIKNMQQFNFTFAGNIGKLQNLENVISGFSRILHKGKNPVLNIVGDGSNLENLKQIVQKQNISNVVFWGRVPLQEMPKIFDISDVLIISLANDKVLSLTVPAKFQAYLASKKPIFCIMNGEVANLVQKYKLGLYADPDNCDEITMKFDQFLELDKKEYNLFIKNSAALLMEKYDKEKIIDKLIESLIS